MDNQSLTDIGMKPELLSPAGDLECVRAAIENGADAVYFGLHGHNARARATNFDLENLEAVLDLLHRRGVKGYVTLNTLVFPRELDEMERIIRRVAAAGADAIIVQDLAVIRLARALCPDLPVHASTQMTLTSAESIGFVEELGVERVILARELSLEEMRRIRAQTDMPLEVFVHGALCVAYSGQCLTSEALGGRSANRGQCAQACRLPYEVISDGQVQELGDYRYVLSPQDLAAYELIPELVKLGIRSLKIEGRLKTPEYVANITRHYRMAIDAAVAGRPVEFTRRQVEEMELSFSRGLSPGWMQGNNHKQLVEGRSPTKRGVYLGQVQSVRGERVLIELAASLKRGDGVVFDRGRPEEPEQGGRVYEIFQRRKSLTQPVSSGLVELAFGRHDLDLRQVSSGDRIWKTDDPELTRRLRQSFAGNEPRRRVALDIRVTAAVGQPLRITCEAESGARAELESAEPLVEAVRHPLTEEVLRAQLGRLGGSLFELRQLDAEIAGQPMVPLSVLGKLRHQMLAQLEASLESTPRRVVAESSPLAAFRRAIHSPKKNGTTETRRHGEETKEQKTQSVSECGLHLGAIPDSNDSSPCLSVSVVTSKPPIAEVATHNHRGANAPRSPEPKLRVLCRNLQQLDATIDCGVDQIYADFQDIREYARAVEIAHARGAEIYLATPRIQKPAEGPLFKHLLRHAPDGILVRNLGGLLFYTARGLPVVGDFSLNAANELTAQLYMERGVQRITASYDLNREQLLDLVAAVPPEWLEVVIHQHMPMFHMEHCVFCAVLSPGTNRTNCGRPCDHHEVQLRDRMGMEHPLKADVGCRNTLFNAVPQSASEHVPELLDRGVRNFRLELLNQSADEVAATLRLYGDLLAGRVSGRQVWTRLNATNRVGVTRGPLET